MTTDLDVGMTLPVMEPHISMETLREWAMAIDRGPFSSICFGERVAFDNPDCLTLLGAVAAWTERVDIATTVNVPQLHHPVALAKALATADLISGGRLTVGVGVGGREEDYRSVGADPATQTRAELTERVATMRAVWTGQHDTGATRPVGPRPHRPGGPPVLVGTLGPKTIRDAASWADGLAGIAMNADTGEVREIFDLTRSAWAEHGRTPRLTTSFWVAFGDGGREQIRRHLLHYMNWLPVDLVEVVSQTAGFAGTPAQLADLLEAMAGVGADEVQLIPTSDSTSDLESCVEAVRLLRA